MSLSNPDEFVREWIEAWNRHDIDAVLSHYADDVSFASPKATAIIGHGHLVGKEELRAYWSASVARRPRILFRLDHAAWDPSSRTLAIAYEARVDGHSTRACEMMRFGEDGLVVSGEAFYGAAL
jgi:hypothetical protein